jgi:hypothetical protein
VTSQIAKLYNTVSLFAEYLISEQRAIFGIKLIAITISKVQENKE